MLDRVLQWGLECRSALPLMPTLNIPLLQSETAKGVFKLASYLTQPICDMHKNWRLVWTIDPLNPEAHKLANYARKAFQYLKVVALGAVGAVPAIFGMGLRALGSKIQEDPWIYIKGCAAEKVAFR